MRQIKDCKFSDFKQNNKELHREVLQYSCHVIARVCLILGILLLGACSRRYHDLPAYSPIPFEDYTNTSVGRFKTSYLAEQIDNYYRGMNPGPLGVTTFVNLDDLYSTSTFGRMYAEQLMSELAIKGFDVIELRHSDALQFLADSGEYALSRDITAVRRERDLGGVIVGTYVASPIRVYVNARLIDPSTSMVLSAGSVEMSKTDELAKLLRGGSLTPTLERIPVRHLGISTYPMYMVPNHLGRYFDSEESGTGAGWGQPSAHTPQGLKGVEPRLAPSAPPKVEPKTEAKKKQVAK